jgi:hypothetical protein
MRRFWTSGDAQETVEFALLAAGVLIPMVFGIIFVGEIFWVWHSAVDFTRDGARYAATHCWQADGGNVTNYMITHVPRMIDMDQFQTGAAAITVQYYMRDPETGLLSDFSCDSGECSTGCVPDSVTVSVTNYEFRRFVAYLGLPSVPLPDFRTSMAVGSGGCDETGNCLP